MRKMMKHATSVLSKQCFEAEVTRNAKENLITSAKRLVLQMLLRGRIHLSSVFGHPIGGNLLQP